MKKLRVIFNMKGAMLSFLFTLYFSLFTHFCKAQNITTVAGNGITGNSGDGGQATAAELSGPNGDVVFDHAGNIYFCDQQNARIQKINTSGIITTIAGTGNAGFFGDGGPATAAKFNQPTVITFDSMQNMLVVDYNNYRIRKIDTSGIVTAFAGNGSSGSSGDGGPATAAELNLPTCVIVDDTGNVYIDDAWNNIIRKVNTSGIITLFAGNIAGGFSGDGGSALLAEFNKPFRIAFDTHWNMYIADAFNSRVREINTSGIVTTLAGNGLASFSGDGGPATAAELHSPYGVCVDAGGNVYIADTYNNRIRVVNPSGVISTLCGMGAGAYGGDGGPASVAEINWPTGVSFNRYGNLFIDDYDNNRVRRIIFNQEDAINEVSANNRFIIYPNPSNGKFTLQMDNAQLTIDNENAQIQIYNVLGEQVYSKTYQPVAISYQPVTIDLSSQPNGIYLYRVIGGEGELAGVGKVIIQK